MQSLAHKKSLFGFSLPFRAVACCFIYGFLKTELSVSVSYKAVSYMRDSTIPKKKLIQPQVGIGGILSTICMC